MKTTGLRFADPVSVSEALLLLRSGIPVAMPTETVYGLAASIDLPQALESIFRIKNRPFFDPLIIHVTNRDPVTELVREIPPAASLLMEAFWPGPLTLVLPKSDRVNPLITSGQDTVAVRMPKHPIALELLKAIGPLAAPSANRFGKTSPTRPAHVLEEFQGLVPVVDGGECEVGIESSIIQVTSDGILKELRPGRIQKKDIEQVLDKHKLSYRWENEEQPIAPGMLKHHYMPDSPLYIFLDVTPDRSLLPVDIMDIKNPVILRLSEEPSVCARQLYHELRTQSRQHDALLLPWTTGKTQGDWAAIWQRLQKASFRIIDHDSSGPA